MKRVLTYILVLFFATTDLQAQTQEVNSADKNIADTTTIDFDRRVALVIGNAGYSRDLLKNPANDAKAVAAVLKKYGFDVILDTNTDRSATLKRINQFGDSITRKKGVSIFYYSGHGMQYKSQNYMLPVQADIEKEEDIVNKAVKVNKVFEKMNETGNGLNIVILDACRNNVFQKKIPSLPEGLTDKEAVPGNTYLFFSASPGKTALDGNGVNSPFTESLLNAIKDSIEFFQVVKKVIRDVKGKTKPVQQPAIAGSPEDDFIFTAKAGGKFSKLFFYPPEELRVAGPSALPFISGYPADKQVIINSAGSALYVLSIGISQYKYLRPLRYAEKDARDISEAMRFQSRMLYDSVESYMLTDMYATRANIMKAVKEISRRAKAGDMIMFFFGGHNESSKDGQSSYFIPVNANVDNSNYINNAIDYEEIRSFLANAPCKSILFLDGNYTPDMAKNISDIENGVAVLASTSAGEFPFEGRQWNNGLFARSLIDGIAGFADADSSGFVNLSELSKFVNERIQKESEGKQHPVSFIYPVLNNFKISKVLSPEVLKEMRMKNLPVLVPQTGIR